MKIGAHRPPAPGGRWIPTFAGKDPSGRTAFDDAFEKKHTDIIALLRDAS